MRNNKIVYGLSIDCEYAITRFVVDESDMLNFTIEKNNKAIVKTFKITVEDAVDRGIINFDKLNDFCNLLKG